MHFKLIWGWLGEQGGIQMKYIFVGDKYIVHITQFSLVFELFYFS